MTAAGAPYCWGTRSGYRATLSGSADVQLTPNAVPGAPTLAAVSVGDWHACGLTPEGVAYCWGDNDWGQLGTGTGTSTDPAPVATDLQFVAISAGSTHTCALSVDGAAHCWGSNARHELGVPWTGVDQGPDTCVVGIAHTSIACSLAPVPVGGGLSFAALDAGAEPTCALLADGSPYCWGTSLIPLDAPVAESGPARVTGAPSLDRLAVRSALCGLTAVGSALCFPAGGVSLGLAEPIVELAVGAFHTCARTGDGLAYCGGENRDGQLGTGDDSSTTALVAVSGPSSEPQP